MLFVSALLWAAAPAAAPASPDPLVGRWHGTSLCQVRASACRDEEAVYYFARKPGGGYALTMDKVGAGAEQEMGTIDAAFVPASGAITGFTYDRSGAPAHWSFTLHG